jgi:CxxC-x17-CxxC domain-containing protein
MAMYEGNWKCSGCGGAITQLPFQPRSESGLTCRDCYGKNKEVEKTEQPVPEMETASEAPPMDGAPDFDEYSSASEPMPFDDAFAGLEDSAPAAASSSNGGDKPKITGNWSCSGCGNAITSLPFEPKGNANLKCLDCFKASKG